VPTNLKPDTWLQITGSYTDRQAKDDINGGPIPFLDVADAQPVSAPAQQYEN
jgi:uncharacterized membrane protein YcgQ (UPF0703/DUF1980 family)